MTSFLRCEFDNIRPLMQKNEKLTSSGFQHGISLAHTILQIHKFETNPRKMHDVFNK